MISLIIQNLRCFTDPRPAPIAPLTLLVGENSTGKTTFLAATRIASWLAQSITTPDFNEEPFPMGAYDQIANLRGGRAGRANSFEIGFEIDKPLGVDKKAESADTGKTRLLCRFTNRNSQPFLERCSVCRDSFEFTVARDSDGSQHAIRIRSHSSSYEISGDLTKYLPFPFPGSPHYFGLVLPRFERMLRSAQLTGANLRIEGEMPPEKDLRVISGILSTVVEAMPPRPYASAPIRTEPRRTYELLKESPRPSGDHVPMILARVYGGAEWTRMKSALERFGESSGLFDAIEIKRLGKQESSPFQIRIKIKGPPFNLVDVGYGVSQALPIVVDLIRGEKGSMYLLQQPEVHLHPRAQAALGTLLGSLVKADNKTFVVETHSDYLIDRVRMDVRDGNTLRPEDVSILYFQREKSGVAIHPMSLDEQGNFKSVPDGYRWFFLNEESRFLGVT